MLTMRAWLLLFLIDAGVFGFAVLTMWVVREAWRAL